MTKSWRAGVCLMAGALILCILLLAPRPIGAQEKKADHIAVKPVPRSEARGWMQRHEGFLARAKKGDVDVLFLGDSITQGWDGMGKEVWKDRFEPLKAANFGIGGDQTQHVLWRIAEGKELEGIHPKVAVLMIGTNNMGSDREGKIRPESQSTAQIAEGVTAIVRELRQRLPETKILLLAIVPRAAKPTAEARAKIREVNQVLARLDDGKNIRYLDIGDKFLDKEGNLPAEIMPDFLHLSPKGYQIWAEAIGPSLRSLLEK